MAFGTCFLSADDLRGQETRDLCSQYSEDRVSDLDIRFVWVRLSKGLRASQQGKNGTLTGPVQRTRA